MNRPLFLLAVPLLTLCAQAWADFYSHKYAGISYSDEVLAGFCDGAMQVAQDLNIDQQTAAIRNCAERGDGWKIYGGWRWTPHWAVEASYQQLAKGETELALNNLQLPFGYFPEWRERDRVSTSLGNVFLVGHWPIAGGLSLFGKVGGGGWNSTLKQRIAAVELRLRQLPEEEVAEGESDVEIIEVPVSGTVSDSRTGFHWSYGAGISYRHHNSWTIRAEWESFSDVGSDDFFTAVDVQSASLGWSMHF